MQDLTNGGLDKAKKFADAIGLSEQFENVLNRLIKRESEPSVGGGQPGESEVLIYPDFAPYSFFWVWRDKASQRTILNGGMIYHGPHDNGGDGSAPSFSVSLEPHHGWSIHT